MTTPEFLTPELLGGPRVDLDNCAREPIHIPGAVQPHGVLLALSWPGLSVAQVSVNCAPLLGLSVTELLGRPLADFLGEEELSALKLFVSRAPGEPNELFAFQVRFGGQLFDAAAHRAAGGVIVELEPHDPRSLSADFFHDARHALSTLEAAPSVQALCDAAAAQVRALTGFDRVMIYRFGEDGHGQVVAEARREDLHSYLDLHFPESDIPRQARALYLRNLLRLTADVHAAPAPLEPLLSPFSGAPLDMSAAALRATSPVHVQYLKNMGVASSLSVSIVQGGRLWGLVSCHHLSAKYVPYATRSALEFLGRVLALQLAAKRETEEALWRAGLRERSLRIASAVSGTQAPLAALSTAPQVDDLLEFARAEGVALCFDGQRATLGRCPGEEQLRRLLAWLKEQGGSVVATHTLPHDFPEALAYEDRACGLLAINLSGQWSEYLIWLRPQVTQTIKWGGDPNKPAQPGEAGQGGLSPRASFATFVQTVQHTSLPWHPVEVEAAGELRRALIEVIAARLAALRDINARLSRANASLSRSNAELKQFAFITSHDLQEPLRQVSSFVDLISRRYKSRLDEEGLEYMQYVTDGATRLREIISDLHAYTEIGTGEDGSALMDAADLNAVLSATLHLLAPQIGEKRARVSSGPLPVVLGHAERLQLLLLHLIGNALKFSGDKPPVIHLEAQREGERWRISVADGGIGIPEEYFETVFTIFKRLNLRDTHAGNGVGLAICRKIVEQHGGRLWVESAPGQGARFSFTLAPAGNPSERET